MRVFQNLFPVTWHQFLLWDINFRFSDYQFKNVKIRCLYWFIFACTSCDVDFSMDFPFMRQCIQYFCSSLFILGFLCFFAVLFWCSLALNGWRERWGQEEMYKSEYKKKIRTQKSRVITVGGYVDGFQKWRLRK